MDLNLYAETQAVAEALEREGLGSDAEALRMAIAAGVTATEILTRVKTALGQTERTNRTESPTIKRRMRALAEAIDKVLS